MISAANAAHDRRYPSRLATRSRIPFVVSAFLAFVFISAFGGTAFAARPEWKVGLAKIAITPRGPLWMAGYSARTKPSEGTELELHAKALALQDRTGRRAVLVTTDMLGFPGSLSQRIAERVEKQFHIPRDHLLFSSSHTLCGPVVDHTLASAYNMTDDQWHAVDVYTGELEEKIVTVIGEALRSLRPGRLSYGRTEASFAVNRRSKTDKGYIIAENRQGPVDHAVPFLRIEDKKGKLLGVVFAYACHNTTLGGDFYRFDGDYAGYAQAWLEAHHPGAVALFMMGCGADANPYPRGTVELAQKHGEELATAVDQALGGTLKPVNGSLLTGWKIFPVAFAPPPTREQWQEQTHSDNYSIRKRAEAMLKVLDRDGHVPADYPYPLEVWQFGRDLTLVAMSGEVVVDYDLRLQRELGAENLWVSGYCNDVFAYIPSRRVLEEGGYEANESMIYYGQPGPWAPAVEDTIVRNADEMVQHLRNEAASGKGQ